MGEKEEGREQRTNQGGGGGKLFFLAPSGLFISGKPKKN